MNRLLARELTLASRRPGLWMAVSLHAAMAAAFMAAWGGEGLVPVLPGSTLYEQLLAVQHVLILAAAPWLAARIAAPERRDDVDRLSMLLNATQQDLLRARLAAAAVWVLLWCLSGFPAALLAHQMSPTTPGGLLATQLQLLVVGCAAASAAVLLARHTDSGVARWTVAWAGSTIVAVAIVWVRT